MRAIVLMLAALSLVACDAPPPDPRPLIDYAAAFPIAPRPLCSTEVIAAVQDQGPTAITRVARQGGQFTCGDVDYPTPLDEAVLRDDITRVQAILDAGANPNARWSSSGDRHALQSAIEASSFGESRSAHTAEIVQLLLRHGADPNARWCPFESRMRWEGMPGRSCNSVEGVTPLVMAAARDQTHVIYLLLDAGADPYLEDWSGRSPLDIARSDAALSLLAAAMFPVGATRNSEMLAYLAGRPTQPPLRGPWSETALTASIVAPWNGPAPPPPPPPPGPRGAVAAGRHYFFERIQALLRMGADPNRRLTWQADWTPLSIAIVRSDPSVVKLLLEQGADPNARWCAGFAVGVIQAGQTSAPECTAANGVTPLMAAAASGRPDQVTLLVEHGADATLQDWRNRTALDYAREAGRTAVLPLLRAASTSATPPRGPG